MDEKIVFYIFQHAESEGPGSIPQILSSFGIETKTIRCWELKNDAAIRFDEPSGAIILGGAMNIYQHRDFPWLPLEKKILSRLLELNLPAIGICLGAQLLTDLAGGKVVQNPLYELGWWPVHFTPIARQLFPELPSESTIFHWHGDTCILPKNSTLLASSAACPVQAFLLSHHILGIQFHPEMDENLVHDFLSGDLSDFPSGPFVHSPDQIRSQTPIHLPTSKKILTALLKPFLKINLNLEHI